MSSINVLHVVLVAAINSVMADELKSARKLTSMTPSMAKALKDLKFSLRMDNESDVVRAAIKEFAAKHGIDVS